VYEVKLLDSTNSRLFNWNAFYSEVPSIEFRDLAESVADACGGHSLVLEIIGASFFDQKDPNVDSVQNPQPLCPQSPSKQDLSRHCQNLPLQTPCPSLIATCYDDQVLY
jgi:hypothetical protein